MRSALLHRTGSVISGYHARKTVVIFPKAGHPMEKGTIVIAALTLVLSAGCSIQRAEVAQTARVNVIGLPKEKVLACMGIPSNRMTVGDTEVWAYESGNGRTQSSVFASGGNGFASGIAVSTRRFCNVNVVMTNGVVSKVNYSGPTGGLLTAGEQCAFAVQNCTLP